MTIHVIWDHFLTLLLLAKIYMELLKADEHLKAVFCALMCCTMMSGLSHVIVSLFYLI